MWLTVYSLGDLKKYMVLKPRLIYVGWINRLPENDLITKMKEAFLISVWTNATKINIYLNYRLDTRPSHCYSNDSFQSPDKVWSSWIHSIQVWDNLHENQEVKYGLSLLKRVPFWWLKTWNLFHEWGRNRKFIAQA